MEIVPLAAASGWERAGLRSVPFAPVVRQMGEDHVDPLPEMIQNIQNQFHEFSPLFLAKLRLNIPTVFPVLWFTSAIQEVPAGGFFMLASYDAVSCRSPCSDRDGVAAFLHNSN